MQPEYAGVRAVGFDLDGTLADTHIDYLQLCRWVEEHLLAAGVPEEAFDSSFGPKLRLDDGKHWLTACGRGAEAETLTTAYNRFSQDLEMSTSNLDRVTAFPGTAELLDQLKSRHIPFGILTQGSRIYAETMLDRIGLRNRVGTLITRDDYPPDEAKPAAAALGHLASRLGTVPADLLYTGDLKIDLLTARSAGARFVAVSSGDIDTDTWRKIDPAVTVLPYAAGITDLLF